MAFGRGTAKEGNGTEYDVRSFILPFAKMRSLNKGKKNAVNTVLSAQKYVTNTIYADMFNSISFWQGMTREDATFVRQVYEREFQEERKMKAVFVQNMVGNAKTSFFNTLKGLKALNKNTGRKDRIAKAPRVHSYAPFNLDDRHFSKKGETIQLDTETGIYYFQFSHPSKDKKNTVVRLPLTGYENVRDRLDSIVNKTFNGKVAYAIVENGIKVTTFLPRNPEAIVLEAKVKMKDVAKTYGTRKSLDVAFSKTEREYGSKEKSDILSGIENETYGIQTIVDKLKSYSKRRGSESLSVIGLDFGKRITLSNGKMIDLSRFYASCKRIKERIAELDSKISTLKNARKFGPEYDVLKDEKKRLHSQITNLRKTTYWHVAKMVMKIVKSNGSVLSLENLSFSAIEKDDPKYRGRERNDELTVMASRVWVEVVKSLAFREGFPILLCDPSYTSQACGICFNIDAKNRNGIKFRCRSETCDNKNHADYNASVNVQALGFAEIINLMKK